MEENPYGKVVTTRCNHQFCQECFWTWTKKNNSCPYCRSNCGYLPVVSGLKKIIVGVHVKSFDEINNYTINTKCNHIITRGKNKGNKCNKKCKKCDYSDGEICLSCDGE